MFLPLVPPPGEAQVDFGEATIRQGGVERKVALFVMTLPYSGAIFIQAFPRECSETFLEGHRRAFEFFGGVPRRISYDNSAIAVIEVLAGRERKLTKEFLEHFRKSSSVVSLALLESPQSRRTAVGKPYSVDLRMRVVGAVDGGDAVEEVAERYAVTERTVWSWLALRKSTGSVEPRKGAVGPRPKLEEHREQIEAEVRSSSSLTLQELRLKLQLPGCVTTLWKALDRWGQSLKKK